MITGVPTALAGNSASQEARLANFGDYIPRFGLIFLEDIIAATVSASATEGAGTSIKIDNWRPGRSTNQYPFRTCLNAVATGRTALTNQILVSPWRSLRSGPYRKPGSPRLVTIAVFNSAHPGHSLHRRAKDKLRHPDQKSISADQDNAEKWCEKHRQHYKDTPFLGARGSG